mmetsp:Transcript_21421/g.53629  ORF Transcript_21421/g.53629 Transcript_21421/m.53629 type:complete len:223 (+) Transcript_21421:577-1245(+)
MAAAAAAAAAAAEPSWTVYQDLLCSAPHHCLAMHLADTCRSLCLQWDSWGSRRRPGVAKHKAADVVAVQPGPMPELQSQGPRVLGAMGVAAEAAAIAEEPPAAVQLTPPCRPDQLGLQKQALQVAPVGHLLQRTWHGRRSQPQSSLANQGPQTIAPSASSRRATEAPAAARPRPDQLVSQISRRAYHPRRWQGGRAQSRPQSVRQPSRHSAHRERHHNCEAR